MRAFQTAFVALVTDAEVRRRSEAEPESVLRALAADELAPVYAPAADFDEPELFHRVVEAPGCGVLLDLTNLLINGRNFGFDPLARMREYPLDAVVQVHLAGGFDDDGSRVDGHSHAVEEDSFGLLAALRGRAPLVCAIVERDEQVPPLPVLVAEAARAQQVWEAGTWT